MVSIAIVVMTTMVASIHHDTIFAQYQLDVAESSEHIYNAIKRDVMLGGAMASSWDSLSATDSMGDTLLIRFSAIDSVRYFRTENGVVYREDVPVVDNIESFRIEKEPTGAINVTVVIAAKNTSWMVAGGYRKLFEWVIVPRTLPYRLQEGFVES